MFVIFINRKSSLNLIRKMIHYIQPQLLTEMCSSDSPTYAVGTMLVEVIANVLDNEVSKDFFAHYCCSGCS